MEKKPTTINISQIDNPSEKKEGFKGSSTWAAFSNVTAYLATVIPVTWALFGAMDVALDKVFRKIPITQNTLGRFKFPFDLVSGTVTAGMVGWGAYKEGKQAFHDAEIAKEKFNILSAERDIYRHQLQESGIAPHDVLSTSSLYANDSRHTNILASQPVNTLHAPTAKSEKLEVPQPSAELK